MIRRSRRWLGFDESGLLVVALAASLASGCLKKGDTNLTSDSDGGSSGGSNSGGTGGGGGGTGGGGGSGTTVCDQELCFDVSTHTTGEQPLSLVVADLNGDAKPDIATANFKSDDVSVLLSTSTHELTTTGPFAGVPKQAGLFAADLQADGKLDLLSLQKVGGNVQPQLNDGSGNFTLGTPVATGTAPNGATAADLDGDTLPELVVALSGTDPTHAIAIWPNSGNGNFGAQALAAGTPGAYAVTAGDFDADGKADLALSAPDDRVHLLHNDGSGQLSTAGDFDVGSQPLWLLAAPLDDGSSLDLVTVNQASGSVSVLLGTGSGGFGGQLVFGVGTSPRGIAAADVDGDGKLDLVVGSESLPGVSILLNDGTGHFPAYRKLVLDASPTAVGAADFDGDGRTDIAVSMSGSGVTVLWGKGP